MNKLFAAAKLRFILFGFGGFFWGILACEGVADSDFLPDVTRDAGPDMSVEADSQDIAFDFHFGDVDDPDDPEAGADLGDASSKDAESADVPDVTVPDCGVCEVYFTRPPYLQHVTQNSIRILWFTNYPGDSTVKFGASPNLGQVTYGAGCPTRHLVEVSGLSPNTTYYYQTSSCSRKSEVHLFKTAPPPEIPFKFTVYGDTQAQPGIHTQVVNGMIAANPDIVLHAGDIIQDGNNYSDYETEFFAPARPLMYNKSMYIAIGNHQYESQYYYNAFSFPESNVWYSFPYGNSFFIFLNTNLDYSPDSEQYQWFEQQLSSTGAQTAEFRFVVAHHPGFCQGWDSSEYEGETEIRTTLMPLMEEYAVDIYFTGHAHDYERGYLNGVTYIISGGGGGFLDSKWNEFDHFTVYESLHHFVQVAVNGSRLELKAIEPDGSIFDTYAIEH